MAVPALLAGILIACAVYLLLAGESWRRLAGLALLGSGAAMMLVTAGGGSPASIRVATAIVSAIFALFIACAALSVVRANTRREPPRT